MLFALALTLSANTVFATANTTTNVSDQNISQISQTNGQNSDKNTVESSKQQTTSEQTKNMAAGSPTATKQAAAGSTVSTKAVTTQKSFTSSQINSAASSVKTFIEKNKRLPNYVTISSVQVSMPQFLKLMTTQTINLNSKTTKSVTLSTVGTPSTVVGSFKAGSLSKSKYIALAKTINTYINSNGKAPSTVTTSLGKISFKDLVYTYSKILNFQKSNKRLPNYVTVNQFKWKTSGEGSGSTSGSGSSTSTSSLSKYLAVTANAQSNSSTIKNLAASITKGKTTTYAKAQAIFNWVRDHISYSFYYNTKKGALGTLSSRSANCVDYSHLVVALSRAAGIPARYQHGTVTFSGGTYGHVWAQLYVNGKWYYADAISKINVFSLSIPNNWKGYSISHTYASLPF